MRERNLHRFSSGKAQVVVATDVAARGIHVDNVGLVVHFDAASDAKAYLHRCGRTARAGEPAPSSRSPRPRQVDEVVRLQSRAGVESLHHDIRTTPRPMTAEALRDLRPGAQATRRLAAAGSGRQPRRHQHRAAPGRHQASAAAATVAARRHGDERSTGRPSVVSRSER